MDKTRNGFAVVLSAVVVIITVVAVLAIWGVLDQELLRRFFWKLIQSLFVILISGGVIYLVYALLYKPDKSNQNQQNQPPI